MGALARGRVLAQNEPKTSYVVLQPIGFGFLFGFWLKTNPQPVMWFFNQLVLVFYLGFGSGMVFTVVQLGLELIVF